MSPIFCNLLSSNGVAWRLAFLNNSYVASISSGCCSICSLRIDFYITSDKESFYVHFSDSFILFPISELEKFNKFNNQVQLSTAAA